MPVNIGDYVDLTPFRFWCQKVLPAVYDDSLSYYELLGKVVKYVNVLIENGDLMAHDIEAIASALNSLSETVDGHGRAIQALQDEDLSIWDRINRLADHMDDMDENRPILLNYNLVPGDVTEGIPTSAIERENAGIPRIDQVVLGKNGVAAVVTARNTDAHTFDVTSFPAFLYDYMLGNNKMRYIHVNKAIKDESMAILRTFNDSNVVGGVTGDIKAGMLVLGSNGRIGRVVSALPNNYTYDYVGVDVSGVAIDVTDCFDVSSAPLIKVKNKMATILYEYSLLGKMLYLNMPYTTDTENDSYVRGIVTVRTTDVANKYSVKVYTEGNMSVASASEVPLCFYGEVTYVNDSSVSSSFEAYYFTVPKYDSVLDAGKVLSVDGLTGKPAWVTIT